MKKAFGFVFGLVMAALCANWLWSQAQTRAAKWEQDQKMLDIMLVQAQGAKAVNESAARMLDAQALLVQANAFEKWAMTVGFIVVLFILAVLVFALVVVAFKEPNRRKPVLIDGKELQQIWPGQTLVVYPDGKREVVHAAKYEHPEMSVWAPDGYHNASSGDHGWSE